MASTTSSGAAAAAVHTLGLADSSKSNRERAMQLFSRYKASSGESINDMTAVLESYEGNADDADALMSEHIKFELLSLATYISNTSIKAKNNKGQDTKKDSECKTLVLYFDLIRVQLNEKYQSLSCWDKEEMKLWFTPLRNGMETSIKRRLLNGSDGGLTAPDTRPLVRRVDPTFIQLLHRNGSRTWESYWKSARGRDLECMCKELMSEPSSIEVPYEHRLILIMMWLGAGRGGEPKHMKWNTVHWDPYFLCIVTLWTQIKTLHQKEVPFVADYDSMYMDVYHAIACFAVAGGLHRSNPYQRATNKYVFPSLVSTTNDRVTGKVTAVIKKLTDPVIKAYNKAKGVRKGANTQMGASANVSDDEHRMLGGFARPDNSESYVMSVAATTQRPAQTLAGWPNADASNKVYPPDLDAIGAGSIDKIGQMISRLYVISVPELQPGGQLEMLTKTMTAALLMHHPDMEKEYGGGNMIVEKVNEAAAASNISQQELIGWSGAIKKKFHDDNFPASPRNQDQTSDIAYLTKQVTNLQRMYYAEKANTKRFQAEMSANNAMYESLVQELRQRDQLDRIRDQRDARRDSMLESILMHHSLPIPGNDTPTAGKRSRIASPSNSTVSAITSPSSLSTSSHSLPAGGAADATGTITGTLGAMAVATAGTGSAAAAAPVDNNAALPSIGAAAATSTHRAAAPKRRTGTIFGLLGQTSSGKMDETISDANMSLSDALIEMHKRGSLANSQKLSSYGDATNRGGIVRFVSSHNQNKINKCFKLVELAWSEEDQRVLRTKYVEAADQSVQSQLKSAAVNIEKASLKMMLELEKSVGIKPKERGKAKITGLGERFRKYEAAKKAKNM